MPAPTRVDIANLTKLRISLAILSGLQYSDPVYKTEQRAACEILADQIRRLERKIKS